MIPATLGSMSMVIITILFGRLYNSIIWNICMIIICIFSYATIILIIPKSRNKAMPVIRDVILKITK